MPGVEGADSSVSPLRDVPSIGPLFFSRTLFRLAGLTEMTGLEGGGDSINAQGEEQKKLDVITNDVLKEVRISPRFKTSHLLFEDPRERERESLAHTHTHLPISKKKKNHADKKTRDAQRARSLSPTTDAPNGRVDLRFVLDSRVSRSPSLRFRQRTMAECE